MSLVSPGSPACAGGFFTAELQPCYCPTGQVSKLRYREAGSSYVTLKSMGVDISHGLDHFLLKTLSLDSGLLIKGGFTSWAALKGLKPSNSPWSRGNPSGLWGLQGEESHPLPHRQLWEKRLTFQRPQKFSLFHYTAFEDKINKPVGESLTNSTDMSLSKPQKVVKDRGYWCAAVHGVAESWTRLSD